MGLNTNTGGGGGNMVFLNPINTADGVRWARRVTKGVDGSVEREAKCGLVHELYYSWVTGFIQAVRIVDKGQYGEDLQITMKDDDPDSELLFILQTGFSGDIGKGFIVRMQNIDRSEVIKIGVCDIDEKRFLYANQRGNKVENAYKKDNPEGNQLPEPIKTEKRGGKVDWDWEDHENALFEITEGISIGNGWAKNKDEFIESFCTAHKDDPAPVKPDVDPAIDDEDDEPF